jgi:hypothetical protein
MQGVVSSFLLRKQAHKAPAGRGFSSPPNKRPNIFNKPKQTKGETNQ